MHTYCVCAVMPEKNLLRGALDQNIFFCDITNTLANIHVKPYTSDKYRKLFSTKASLNCHMRTHTGEKLFSRVTCGNRLTRSRIKNITCECTPEKNFTRVTRVANCIPRSQIKIITCKRTSEKCARIVKNNCLKIARSYVVVMIDSMS